MKNQYKYFLVLIVLLVGSIGCKKFVEVPPPVTGLVSATVYDNNTSASSAITAIYETLMTDGATGGSTTAYTGYSILTGLSADELQAYPNSVAPLPSAYENSLQSNASPPILFWSSLYNEIYLANSAIEGLDNSSGLTPSTKQQLTGEALFARAFCFFYLVNTYGDVPMPLTIDYKTNALLSRTPKGQVYQQIISDLATAQGLLADNYLDPTGATTTERTLPNKATATAFLARVYLYYGNLSNDANNYNKAVTASSLVINNSLFALSPLNSVFLANSTEAIWQLQPVQPGFNTPDGYTFILTTVPNSVHPVYLSNQLLAAFEPGDNRKTNWIGNYSTYYYPYKYKLGYTNAAPMEYLMVLRLAEQYLIRAEAEAKGATGGISAAVADMNVIRNRAGLANYAGATDQASVLAAILHERQVELFTEWGHRWLDLKRTGNVDAVMSVVTPLKGGIWNTNDQLYPIPLTEIKADPNLIQNPGY